LVHPKQPIPITWLRARRSPSIRFLFLDSSET
jgi:hypothetical protein